MTSIIKINLFLFLTLSFPAILFSQSDSTVYKNLSIRKSYPVNLWKTTSGNRTTYQMDGKSVSKETYDKYKGESDGSRCCPCIKETYDKNNVLLNKAVRCGDCGVGWFEIYYPNGKLKTKGQYKENPTGNWENLLDRGYCYVKEGKWIYYSKHGPKYVEIWKDGVFIKQIPEQDKAEVWDAQFLLNEQKLAFGDSITIADIQAIKTAQKFKNSHRKTNFKLKVKFTADGHPTQKTSCTTDTLKDLNIQQFLSKMNVPANQEIIFSLILFDDQQYIRGISLNLVRK